MSFDGPCIIQSDHTVLLEVDHKDANDARHDLASFAELERAPEHFHTYAITKLGLWNAAASGVTAEWILQTLEKYAKFPVPQNVRIEIIEAMERYGRLKIVRYNIAENSAEVENSATAVGTEQIMLVAPDAITMREATRNKQVTQFLSESIDDTHQLIAPWARGELKQALLKRGWPVEDTAGFTPGAPLDFELTETDWQMRNYQKDAVARFVKGGNGVVVLPCGAGKTLVGAAAMTETKAHTLILVTGQVSASQWREELLKRTSLTEDQIGEYSGRQKEVKPVTIATYQILTAKKNKEYAHLSLLNDNDWGLIVYDEVHLLPAPVFKLTAELQARKRLGLTATLIREDGRERDVFSLIGPKRYEAPWKDLENQGFIAPAECFEVRIPLTEEERFEYAAAEDQDRYRLAASTPEKLTIIKKLLEKYPNDQVLIIGQYIDQLEMTAAELQVPLITGKTPHAEREEIFTSFRLGKERVLVVSKVANFSVDLPDASLAIQISGSYGSRQEEAQRLGRILRPGKDDKVAHFYSLITEGTVDQDFAQSRQRFLAEQGYSYTILKSHEL